MGFDITGLNPKNLHLKEPKQPDNLWELPKEKQDKYFEKRDEYTSQSGTYFRNNVWWWRRLADFVCEQTGVIAETDKEHWQSNSGHEVSEEEAKQIALQLKALIKDGTVSKVITEVEKEMEVAEKNNKFVDRCHEMLRAKVEKDTGKTNLAPADYPKDDHDTWDWIQSKYSYGSSYPFTMENVQEFIEFCEQSNGFRIC